MKTSVHWLVAGLLAYLLTACTSSKNILKATGDIVDVEMASRVKLAGEFLFARDSAIYILMRESKDRAERVYAIPLTSIRSLHISGYANREWLKSFLMFQIVPTAIFAIEVAANSNDVDWGILFLVLGTPSLTTYVALEASTPDDPQIRAPFYDLGGFCKYARYPQGLDRDQLSQLLKLYHQADVESLR